jgi:hypothetical protein
VGICRCNCGVCRGMDKRRSFEPSDHVGILFGEKDGMGSVFCLYLRSDARCDAGSCFGVARLLSALAKNDRYACETIMFFDVAGDQTTVLEFDVRSDRDGGASARCFGDYRLP